MISIYTHILDSVSLRKMRLQKLAEEIKGQHLYVTTVTVSLADFFC